MSRILRLFRIGRAQPETIKMPDGPDEHVRLTNPWHAVSVVPCKHACDPAKSLSNKRFLSSDGPPRLPLEGCTAHRCTCRYRHHADRRAPAQLTNARGGTGAAHPHRRTEDVTP